jgi:DNA-binding GntR family transcriptional regulator
MATRTGIEPLALESQSLVDRVSHAVRAAILEGRLRPNEPLSISDLASDLNVSHSPVREALQRLSGQGLVVLRQARSAIVAPLELEDLREIYRLRELLEVDAAGRAARLLTDENLALMASELELLSKAIVDTDDFWDHHNAFHRALMAPALTPRQERLITELGHAAERYLRVVYSETAVFFSRSPADRHLPLLEAARTRRTATVRKALSEHLRSNAREITSNLAEILSQPRSAPTE